MQFRQMVPGLARPGQWGYFGQEIARFVSKDRQGQ
jgi:hypothetical protein